MKEPGKRIVSKAEYATVQGRKIGKLCLLLVYALVVLGGLGFAVKTVLTSGDVVNNCMVFIPLITVVFSVSTWKSFKDSFKQIAEIDPGVPFTRANTADLPAPDSLVRASEEPVQEQQAVLLRAAMTSEQTPSKQLVRPVGGCE